MNFFESQDRVRKNTMNLVFLFILAVGTLIIMTNLLVMLVFGYLNQEELLVEGNLVPQMDWQVFITVGVGVGLVVLLGSLYKIMSLSSGGKSVAESLGGQLIPQDTRDLNQRKLLNIVEEMAIASGTPAPPVYLLVEEQGINAFAAGFSPRDAVIGVTQGTIEQLSRDQLQGVIAHEFSHIFNGDMRLNIRLMGVLHGILILGFIGYFILRSAAFSGHRSSNNKSGGGLMALGLGLIVIGFAGTFFGGMIKAAVSRQREFLADASAVQFTRNPDGIAGALKRIGGLEYGSGIDNPGAPEVSHALFAQGMTGFMQSLSATHPPLDKRIMAIDPHWDGEFDYTDASQTSEEETDDAEDASRQKKEKLVTAVVTGAAVMAAIDQIGNPNQETLNYARSLLSELPTSIIEAAHEPYGARAIIYAFVIDTENDIRKKQIQQLQEYADPGVYALTLKLLQEIENLDIKFRLPLIDIAIPALKQLSLDQYKVFKSNLNALIEMDSRIDLMEWSLQNILFSHLDGQFFKLKPLKARYSRPRQVKKEIQMLLSVIAYAGHKEQVAVEKAFLAGATSLGLSNLTLHPKDEIGLSEINLALKKITQLKPLLKPRILKACVACIVHDDEVTPMEIELLRAFSDVIDCPMPPVISKTS